MANASSEIVQPTETQRAETAANRFSDMAEKGPAAKDPKAREMFQKVGDETRSGNFDKAQRILESGATWDDDLRGAASEVNQLDQEKRRVKPMSFEDAQKMTDVYALRHEAQATRYDEKSATRTAHLEHATSLRGASRPGVEGIDGTLQYIEQGLKDMAEAASKNPLTREELQDWQEKRAIRDALYQEKQKRVEQMKQSQRGTEELSKGRESTARGLEKLYADAGIPEGTASRQEFFGRVSAMSPEELSFLDSALNKAAREAVSSGDPKMLEGLLGDLSTKSFKRKDVEARQEAEDQRKIEEIRKKMGLPEQQPEKPSGRSEEKIERSRKRIEEMMPSKEPQRKKEPTEEAIARKKRLEDFLKREKGAAESQPPIKEAPRQERGRAEARAENPFEKLFGSKEITDALDNPKDTRGYTAEQGVAAMTEVFKGLYQNPKQFATRVETLLGKFRSAVEDSKRSKPTVSEEGHRNVANKEVIKRLSQSEKQAIDKFLDANYQKMGGKFHRMISTEWTFGDFISFLEGLKK